MCSPWSRGQLTKRPWAAPRQSLTWHKSPQSGFLPQNIKPGYLKLQLRVRNEVREEEIGGDHSYRADPNLPGLLSWL